MIDLSDWLAKKTVAHVKEQIGGNVGSRFREGLFERDTTGIKTWGGYRLNFFDNGKEIRIGLGDGKNSIDKLRAQLGELSVPSKYRSVVSDANIDTDEKGLYIILHMSGGEARVTNKEKLFYAVYNVGVKPALKAIFELHE